MKLKVFFFTAAAILLGHQLLYAWGSMDDTVFGGIFGTHQMLCRKAYEKLKDHPALKYVQFPSIEDIIAQSGTNLSIEGPGPDSPKHSTYKHHWYNPLTKAGEAPKKVSENYEKLQTTLRDCLLLPESAAQERKKLMEDAAHDAAYAGHYAQDLTCPVHLNGMNKSDDRSKPQGIEVSGPYTDYVKNPERWESSVKASNADKNPTADWFDPNYYNGPWPMENKGSTHVLYETVVALRYTFTDGSDTQLAETLKTDYAKKFWKNGMDASEFMHDIAHEVRVLVDKHDPQIYVDENVLRKEAQQLIDNGADTIKTALKDKHGAEVLDTYLYTLKTLYSFGKVLSADVPIPYREWARATQATYILWRASFSGLMIKKENIVLVKIPNKPEMYKVKVKVSNLEPEDSVTDVSVTYKYKENDTTSSGGTATIASIGPFSKDAPHAEQSAHPAAHEVQSDSASDSDWVEIPGEIKISGDLAKSNGILRFAVKGTYHHVPDSEMAVVQYIVKDNLLTDAIRLPDVKGAPRVEAINDIKGWSRNFQVDAKMGEPAREEGKQDTVISQEPPGGTWVSPTDKVVIWVYNDYLVANIKGRISDMASGHGVKGATILVTAGGDQASTTADEHGRFELAFRVSPEVINNRMPFTAHVTHPQYAPYQNILSTKSEWDIQLRQNVEPEVAVRLEKFKQVEDPVAGNITGIKWAYEAIFTVKNVAVYFSKMDIQENSQNGSSNENDCNISIIPGQEKRCYFETSYLSVYNNGDLNNLQQKITLKGFDDNNVPRMYTFVFDSHQHAVQAAKNTNADFAPKELIEQYVSTYEQTSARNPETFEMLPPIQDAYKGKDYLVFVRTICEKKKSHLLVDDISKHDLQEFCRLVTLAQFYIYKTSTTGDQRYEQQGAYIFNFLAPSKEMYRNGRVPAWCYGDAVANRAQQLAPDFFNY